MVVSTGGKDLNKVEGWLPLGNWTRKIRWRRVGKRGLVNYGLFNYVILNKSFNTLKIARDTLIYLTIIITK